MYVLTYFSVFLTFFLPIFLSTYLPFYLSTYLPIYLSTYLPIYLSTYLPIYLSSCLSIFISPYLLIFLTSYLLPSFFLSSYCSIFLTSYLLIIQYLYLPYLHIFPYSYRSIFLSSYLSFSFSKLFLNYLGFKSNCSIKMFRKLWLISESTGINQISCRYSLILINPPANKKQPIIWSLARKHICRSNDKWLCQLGICFHAINALDSLSKSVPLETVPSLHWIHVKFTKACILRYT